MVRRRQEALNVADSFETLRSDYNMARSTRFRRRRSGVSVMGSGADYHIRSGSDFFRCLEISRDMDRNDCVIGQLIDRATQVTIQSGISHDPQTGDKGLDDALAARWIAFATDPQQCDLAGQLCFEDFEFLALRHCFVDGDIILLPDRSGPLAAFEAHRMRTPKNTSKNVVHGVELDQHRKHLAYWISKEDVDPNKTLTRVSDVNKYPVRDEEDNLQAFHICVSKKRVSQTRGMTALAPIIDLASFFEDITFAHLVQSQLASCFAVIRERDLGFQFNPNASARGEKTTEILADGSTRRIEGTTAGMEIKGDPGEKIHLDSANVPNEAYFPHVKLLLTLIGANLGMPLVLVLLSADETNFSGWRGAMESAKYGFKQNQRRLVRQMHRPIRNLKIRQWMAEEPLLATFAERDGIDIFNCQWNFPRWPYIQPREDQAADLIATRNLMTSQRRRCQERLSCSWDDLSSEIVEDNALVISKAFEKAEELNKAHEGLDVSWREVACLPTPDGVRLDLMPPSETSGEGQQQSQPNQPNPSPNGAGRED